VSLGVLERTSMEGGRIHNFRFDNNEIGIVKIWLVGARTRISTSITNNDT
jgi:hypothetical protein